MKKILSAFLILTLFFTVLITTGCAAEANKSGTNIILQIGNPNMTANGTEKPIDAEGTAPVISNGRTLLPIRAVVEEMGGTAAWNGAAREVTLSLSDDEIKLNIDSATAYLNGIAKTLDTAPAIINGRTMIPIRFIAESFKFDVAWDNETQKITITKKSSPDSDAAIKETDNTHSKTLVVYFSATGTTKKLAEKFAAAANADIFEIVPKDPYSVSDLNYNADCRANREQNDDMARPEIGSYIENFDEYNTIIIGHPIWWGTIPRIIYTFMDTHDLSGKDVYMFCTSGSSGIGIALSDVKKYAPKANLINGMRGTSSTTESSIKDWLKDNGYNK